MTVQSSETLKPCILNFGFFLNYAANSLSYSQSVGSALSGTKAGDRILGADLSLGMGLGENWDVGFSVPVILSQELSNDQGVAYFGKQGVTEIKLATKYRFYGDERGGFAEFFR